MINSNQPKFCSSCGGSLYTVGQFCPGCGSTNSDGKRFCSECGHKLDDIGTICQHCGVQLKNRPAVVAEPQFKPDPRSQDSAPFENLAKSLDSNSKSGLRVVALVATVAGLITLFMAWVKIPLFNTLGSAAGLDGSGTYPLWDLFSLFWNNHEILDVSTAMYAYMICLGGLWLGTAIAAVKAIYDVAMKHDPKALTYAMAFALLLVFAILTVLAITRKDFGNGLIGLTAAPYLCCAAFIIARICATLSSKE